MSEIYLYNTLSRKKEIFKPIVLNQVGLYTCGPTVYNEAHIGNLRTYLFEDFLKRTLEYNDYKVKHVMNITDVGHLTGDGDMGEDKMEVGAKREGKTAWEISEFYTKLFKNDLELLNIEAPSIWCRATETIPEQIELIKKLEDKEYTYKTSDGIYFDTSKLSNYNKLSHLPLEKLREGARVEKNIEKKNATDFALWKFSPRDTKRQMEWESPWGIGFPGWHVECSAMSLKYLKNELDIHCGGIDHINIHHTNEIAQSESATGKKFFNYFIHGAFLNIKGGKKMAKSEDNFLSLTNALEGISPLAYRFAALQVHYRKPMEYNEGSFRKSQEGLNSLYKQVASLGKKKGQVDFEFREKFLEAINNDLNTTKALSVLSSVLKSKLKPEDKLSTILDFDKVLGLSLEKEALELLNKDLNTSKLPKNIQELVTKRQSARKSKNWSLADSLRIEIENSGYVIEDVAKGEKVRKK